MNWSFRIARIRGFNIKVHITFFLILILGAFQGSALVGGDPLEGALFGVALMILLFTCVTLHELGHSLVAQRFGVPVREIVLLPFGGVALLSKNPAKPLHELLIAIAGPLVNVAIAALLFLAMGANLSTGASLFEDGLLRETSLTAMGLWLFAANVSLVVFNLIPAFPMDGGRVFRAIMAMLIGNERATRIAARVGQIVAIGLGLFGIVSGSFMLTLIALFIFFSAGQEQAQVRMTQVLQTVRVGEAYNKHAIRLQAGDRVSTVINYILTSYQPDYAVMQGENPIGVVTRDDVLRSLANSPVDRYVTEVMQRDFLKVGADKTIDEVRQLMSEQGKRFAAVYEGPQYLGLINLEDVSEALSVLSYMQRQRQLRQGSNA